MAVWQDSFWVRMGLQEMDEARCLEVVKRRYDCYHVEKFEYQGYCSFTLLVSWPVQPTTIVTQTTTDYHAPTALLVQFRPVRYALDIDVVCEASRLYTSLVPKVRALDMYLPGELHAYESSRLPGTPLSYLLPHTLITGTDQRVKQETLITNFAHVIAQAWPSKTVKERKDSVQRADSLWAENQSMLSLCTGKVGSRIAQKLKKLVRELPDQRLRERARITLDKCCALNYYPVVLNHGDLIPSNILVNEQTWEITGLVDWAEAEHLPFGTSLYGLEHLLGFVQLALMKSDQTVFVYQKDAACLRQLFWDTLISAVPELANRREEVQIMRDLGVLLWHGYAWDEGAIDRVVDEMNDGEELAKLRAFLSI